MNKKYLLFAIVPVLALAAIGTVYADSTVTNGARPMANIVNAIAERFNLDVSDVQVVFNEQKEIKKAEMEQKFTDRINQAVVNSELTQEQANQIIAKKAELETERQNLQNGTPKENREIAKQHMNELKQWADENNIPLQYLSFGKFGGGRHMGSGCSKFGGPAPNQNAE